MRRKKAPWSRVLDLLHGGNKENPLSLGKSDAVGLLYENMTLEMTGPGREDTAHHVCVTNFVLNVTLQRLWCGIYWEGNNVSTMVLAVLFHGVETVLQNLYENLET